MGKTNKINMEPDTGALLSKEMFVSGTQVKKGKKMEKAHRYQLLYYLYYLNELKGVENVEGEIDYPLLRKKERIVLTEDLKDEIRKILKGIREVIAMPEPPKPAYLRICRKCAYFEFCWV